MTVTRLPGLVPVTFPVDAPPFTRATARALSLNGWDEEASARLRSVRGVVALRSSRDAQAATIRSDESGWSVEPDVAPDSDVIVTVDPDARHLALLVEPDEKTVLASAMLELLDPPLPAWTDVAPVFWDEVRGIAGMPSVRLVDPVSGTTVVLEGGAGECEIHADAHTLAAVLSGLEFFLNAVITGRMGVRSTSSQFSVFAGASMKVMWNV